MKIDPEPKGLPNIDEEKTKRKIEKFIKDKVGNRKAVLGLSGGLDSSLVLKLCEETLGKDKVIGVMLPAGCNSSEDLEDAKRYAEELGVKYHVKNIDSIVEKFLDEFDFVKEKIPVGNVIARTRMVALYSYANEYNGMVVGTTNKTEMMIGYFTKYGDGGADLEPIGDLYKTHVRSLARYMKVLEKIIKKPPSAGLWEGQTDEGEIGMDYGTLDNILYSLENHLSYAEEWQAKKIEKMVRSSSHKRELPRRGGVVYA